MGVRGRLEEGDGNQSSLAEQILLKDCFGFILQALLSSPSGPDQ